MPLINVKTLGLGLGLGIGIGLGLGLGGLGLGQVSLGKGGVINYEQKRAKTRK